MTAHQHYHKKTLNQNTLFEYLLYLVLLRRHYDSFHFMCCYILSRALRDPLLYQNLRGCGSWLVKNLGSLGHSVTIQILTPLCTSWATLSKLLKFSVPWYSHVTRELIMSPYHLELLWELVEIDVIFSEICLTIQAC